MRDTTWAVRWNDDGDVSVNPKYERAVARLDLPSLDDDPDTLEQKLAARRRVIAAYGRRGVSVPWRLGSPEAGLYAALWHRARAHSASTLHPQAAAGLRRLFGTGRRSGARRRRASRRARASAGSASGDPSPSDLDAVERCPRCRGCVVWFRGAPVCAACWAETVLRLEERGR